MRLILAFIFLIGGLGFCTLFALAHAARNAGSASYYSKQIQTFPDKQTYTKMELTEAVWRVWTNRMSLPEQGAYTPGELKTALVNTLHVIGTEQDSCDRSGFEYAIAKVSGYNRSEAADTGPSNVGVYSMLVGAFLLGGIVWPRKRIESN
ncbi:MAG TPA: hypothetical protein VNN22_25005 [Verrucomicrobiae bacterium]|nr:hypothetical protein [Verrucomicrobiae bacterium]